ncbi:hypothetical protein [Paenibacillus sabinae]|uniref:Putative transmembrane anti-sigma factor n=1 Tax=Paenibacillus sabinae T27 TaxID=1268072 RepID=X5A2L4_9BACL|nr:hypothetical protein [Paenibacillus sabinae]AHV98069.1 putative transmembrane anti-sigma factor [Paenibacillus sabinae T27]
MNCREAQNLIPLLWDAPPGKLERIALLQHVSQCSYCTAEWEMWEESTRMIQDIKSEVSEERAEAVNARVMERIYLESPWLMPGDGKSPGKPGIFRRRISLWIACFLAIFLSSFLYFTLVQTPDNTTMAKSGIVPTGVAGSTGDWQSVYPVESSGSQIIEPLVVSMGPTHPQYWMVLSMLGIALSIFSLTRLNRYRRH